MNTTVYIGGHAFEVNYVYEPAVKGSRDSDGMQLEPDTEEDLEIGSIYLGDTGVTTLLIEEACDLFDKIEAQVWAKIREGEG